MFRSRLRPRPMNRPAVECLESRLTPAVTDMTDLAKQFSPHADTLYLNFEGRVSGLDTVVAYAGSTGDRNRDIQEILFRTSEIFAPFKVTVQRLQDASTWVPGASTVFVGDYLLKAGPAAWTPGDSVDYPGMLRGMNHQPNSDLFPGDIAYVDPLGTSSSWGLGSIVAAIAHEAGHTFGLAHIRSTGSDSNGAPTFSNSNPPDMMSYDAPNTRFVNQKLTTTGYNGTPPSYNVTLLPMWQYSLITTQNSYTYLKTLMGARALDDHPNVAHTSLVDTGAYSVGSMTTLAMNASTSGTIGQLGDYDVFSYTPTSSAAVVIQAKPAAGSTLAPTIFVYSGTTLVQHGTNGVAGFNASAGVSYRVVVGARDAASTGAYTVGVKPFVFNLFSAGVPVSKQETSSNRGSSARSRQQQRLAFDPTGTAAGVGFWTGISSGDRARWQDLSRELTQPQQEVADRDAVFVTVMAWGRVGEGTEEGLGRSDRS